MTTPLTLYHEATRLHQAGELAAAEQAYQAYLRADPNLAEGWLRLGILYYGGGRYLEAQAAIARALTLAPTSATAYYSLGLVLEKLAEPAAAIAAYQRAIALEPNLGPAQYQLGCLLQQQGLLDQAIQHYEQALRLDPSSADACLALGSVRLVQQQWEAAIAHYRQALALRPRHPDILQQLGHAFAGQGNMALAHNYWGYACYRRADHETALPHFAQWFELSLSQELLSDLEFVNDALIYSHCLNECGQTQAAIACLTQAQTRSGSLALELRRQLLLPLVYSTTAAIAHYRHRFQQGLATIIAQTRLDTPVASQQALDATGRQTNFYLSFQGQNDRALQAQYGQWLHQIVATNYPQWVMPRAIPQGPGKIRVGYLSEAFGASSATRWVLGWLEHHNRDQFEIYCYHTGEQVNARMAPFEQNSDQFRHLPGGLAAIAPQILQDDLHILVFLALGLRAPTLQLAALRLAPVQCAAWGHPVTSGLPTIDYFLSGELLEPASADEHYTEQLVRLPNLGLAYPSPQIPLPTKERTDFHLRPDAVVYVSCQLIFKYLPQHDYLFAAIARQVPQAQFAFIVRSNQANQSSSTIQHQFQQRLSQAFAAEGLDSTDFCVFLAGEDWAGYTSLLLKSDVFLDTLEFSGGHTTFDAIACQLPVVTQAGKLMRGRQSSAILHRLGVTETIARTEAEYIKIAVRLGQDLLWRRTILQKLANSSHLYNDSTCVVGLEAFYQQAISSNQN